MEQEEYQQGADELSTIDTEKPEDPVDGRSHHGLRVALHERRFQPAIVRFARAIGTQLRAPSHSINRTVVYVGAGIRRTAVETLENGLGKPPKDDPSPSGDEQEAPPEIGFLPLDNVMNVLLARISSPRAGEVCRAERRERETTLGAIEEETPDRNGGVSRVSRDDVFLNRPVTLLP